MYIGQIFQIDIETNNWQTKSRINQIFICCFTQIKFPYMLCYRPGGHRSVDANGPACACHWLHLPTQVTHLQVTLSHFYALDECAKGTFADVDRTLDGHLTITITIVDHPSSKSIPVILIIDYWSYWLLSELTWLTLSWTGAARLTSPATETVLQWVHPQWQHSCNRESSTL